MFAPRSPALKRAANTICLARSEKVSNIERFRREAKAASALNPRTSAPFTTLAKKTAERSSLWSFSMEDFKAHHRW
jgi:hypothetical protein